MKERPILFSGPMVRALLAGTKTQTRRVVKPQPDSTHSGFPYWSVGGYRTSWCRSAADGGPLVPANPLLCPYGQAGDRLWVREAFMHEPADYCWEASVSIPCRPAETVYRADFPNSQPGEGWKPSIHMPRTLSRILLEITGVRMERLQGISEADAYAEGIEQTDFIEDAEHQEPATGAPPGRYAYRALWEDINGPDSWAQNPWVWVVEFKRVQQASSGRPLHLEDAPCNE